MWHLTLVYFPSFSLHAELAASKRQTAAFHRRADALQKENGDLINEKENLYVDSGKQSFMSHSGG